MCLRFIIYRDVIGGRPNFIAAWIVGGLIALSAIISMIAGGIAWSPIAALVFMASAALVGGRTYVARSRTQPRDPK